MLLQHDALSTVGQGQLQLSRRFGSGLLSQVSPFLPTSSPGTPGAFFILCAGASGRLRDLYALPSQLEARWCVLR